MVGASQGRIRSKRSQMRFCLVLGIIWRSTGTKNPTKSIPIQTTITKPNNAWHQLSQHWKKRWIGPTPIWTGKVSLMPAWQRTFRRDLLQVPKWLTRKLIRSAIGIYRERMKMIRWRKSHHQVSFLLSRKSCGQEPMMPTEPNSNAKTVRFAWHGLARWRQKPRPRQYLSKRSLQTQAKDQRNRLQNEREQEKAKQTHRNRESP
mmetsp:Transcript_9479/g.21514  ORF Transcript_9479/g.21514 Transcript_9479/m.21514 type:complete len:204 (+) Transcript_9479:1520-2131(+)